MKILLAIDGSDCSKIAADAVKAQFRPDEAEVCVFTVADWHEALPLSFGYADGPGIAEELFATRDKIIAAANKMVEQTAKGFDSGGFKACGVMKIGHPRVSILEYAAQWRPDLIVLGSHGRRGVERLLLGSVAEGVARHAKCSVYIARKSEY